MQICVMGYLQHSRFCLPTLEIHARVVLETFALGDQINTAAPRRRGAYLYGRLVRFSGALILLLAI